MRPVVVTDFGPELTDIQVQAAAATARTQRVGAVLGLGGGLVLDAAKMIAVLVTKEEE